MGTGSTQAGFTKEIKAFEVMAPCKILDSSLFDGGRGGGGGTFLFVECRLTVLEFLSRGPPRPSNWRLTLTSGKGSELSGSAPRLES